MSKAAYNRVKARSRKQSAAIVLAGQDIGAIPPVKNPLRRARADGDFRFYCESYFPRLFTLAWSPDHLKVIAKIEQAVIRGGLFSMAMPRGSGKALALDTPLPTPEGWTTMGGVLPGDILFDEQGRQCRVTFTTEAMHNRPCYRVVFSDGEAIVCDGEHLWTVNDRYSRRNPLTLTTAYMAGRVRIGNRPDRDEHRYSIPVAQPLQCMSGTLTIPPYALGLWLGNGAASDSRITNHADDHDELAEHVRRCGEYMDRRPCGDKGLACQSILTETRTIPTAMPSFRQRLRTLGLLDNKHIPAAYLRAGAAKRLALLQGLMDTDGSVGRNGRCEITLKDGQLAQDVAELLSSLGVKYSSGEKWVNLDGKRHGPYRRYSFSAFEDRPVFRLRRKRERLGGRPRPSIACRQRHIVAIEPVASVPVRCIQVDSPSQLYLAGRNMVPTHNTTLCQIAVLWAMLTGRQPFVFLIAATAEYADAALHNLKSHLSQNELLLEDYPEAVYPIRCLEGESRRCAGQRYYGRLTHIGWTADQIVLPTIPGSRCSGALVRTAGLLGNIRGSMHIRPDGHSVRPTLVVIDDPQTDQSARSPSQVHERLTVINGAILNLAGPGRRIAAVMPCTVIRNDDLADQILDRSKHPEWQGERTRLVYSFPSNDRLWAEYARLRADSLRNDGDGHEATEFYRANQPAMDVGAAVAWAARYNTGELSAIQHAMNLRLRDEAAFWAEYQNEPLPELRPEEGTITVEQIVAKTNGLARGEVPVGVSHVVAFIDVQATLLYWMVVGWEDEFSGCVLDYGAYPDPKRAYFTLKDAKRTLALVHKGTGQEGAIYAGLEELVGQLCGRVFRRDDGAEMRIERLLIDANWGNSTDVIYQFCRQSGHGAVVMPSHGRYVGASSVPFSDYKRKPGERVGLHWRIPNVQGKRSVRHVVIDTNYWKSFTHARLAVPMGDPGCLSLFRSPMGFDHQLLAEHLTAEYRVKTEARGRTVDEWKAKPGNPDNHWLDCLVGCAVAGSIQGAILFGTDQKQAVARPRLRLSAMQGRRV